MLIQSTYSSSQAIDGNQLHEAKMGPAKRWMYSTVGLLMVAIGIIGVYLPGIPTTGPLLLASFLFTRSNPRLQRWLMQNRFAAKHLGWLDGSQRMTNRLRGWAIACMWTSITVSSCLFAFSAWGRLVLIPCCIAAGMIGTLCIWRFQR